MTIRIMNLFILPTRPLLRPQYTYRHFSLRSSLSVGNSPLHPYQQYNSVLDYFTVYILRYGIRQTANQMAARSSINSYVLDFEKNVPLFSMIFNPYPTNV